MPLNLLKKLTLLILAASFIGIFLIAFDVVNLSQMEKLSTYIGLIVSVLFLLLGEGGGKSGPGSSYSRTGESVTGLTDG